MSDEEVDELLKIADTSSGEVNYTGIAFPIAGHKLLTIHKNSYGRSWQIERAFPTSPTCVRRIGGHIGSWSQCKEVRDASRVNAVEGALWQAWS